MKNKHGGAGRNQGRKKIDPDKKKKSYATKLDPEIIKIIRGHKLSGAQLIERAIRYYVL